MAKPIGSTHPQAVPGVPGRSRLWPLALGLGLGVLPLGVVAQEPVLEDLPPGPEVLDGVVVEDPFRFLEDEKVAEGWIEVQNRRTDRELRDKLPLAAAERLGELLSIGVLSGPQLKGKRLFTSKREGDQERPVVWVEDELGKRILLDPNAWKAEGKIALDWMVPSEDGRYVAYGTSLNGDEESTLSVIDVESGQKLSEKIPWTRACSVAWLPDNSGFYYTRYPEGGGLYHRKVYRHTLGKAWKDDPLIFGDQLEDKTDWTSVDLSEDGSRVVVHVSKGWSRTEVYWAKTEDHAFRTLFDGYSAKLYTQDWIDGQVLAMTNFEADRWRIVRIDPEKPEPKSWTEIIPEGAAVLEDFHVVGNHLVLQSTIKGVSRLSLHSLAGTYWKDLDLPTLGSIGSLSGHRTSKKVVASFSSYFHPPSLLEFEIPSGRTRTLDSIQVDFPIDDFTVEQVEYPSYDGTSVPMLLVHKKDMILDGSHPTLLYGYGGFNSSMQPGFQRNLLFWLEHGGVYAVAQIRGGGELGEAWHQGGKQDKKFQVFFDFEYALRYLIRTGFSRPDRLAIMGGSNGGLLVGATLTRAPNLFRAAIGSVGLYDMVRFAKFPPAELWVDEYGNPDRADQVGYLYGYSPYHQVMDGVRYPAALLLTADKDTRVHWAHTAKFAARLQEAQAGPQPIYFHMDKAQGHGAGKGRSDIIQGYLLRYAFLFDQLGVTRP